MFPHENKNKAKNGTRSFFIIIILKNQPKDSKKVGNAQIIRTKQKEIFFQSSVLRKKTKKQALE
jgi:hypothetical protein